MLFTLLGKVQKAKLLKQLISNGLSVSHMVLMQKKQYKEARFWNCLTALIFVNFISVPCMSLSSHHPQGQSFSVFQCICMQPDLSLVIMALFMMLLPPERNPFWTFFCNSGVYYDIFDILVSISQLVNVPNVLNLRIFTDSDTRFRVLKG